MIHAKQWGTMAKCFPYTRSTEAVVAVLQSTGQQQWATAGQQHSRTAQEQHFMACLDSYAA